eukprot:739441-Pyramimonas_sp.AAC.1
MFAQVHMLTACPPQSACELVRTCATLVRTCEIEYAIKGGPQSSNPQTVDSPPQTVDSPPGTVDTHLVALHELLEVLRREVAWPSAPRRARVAWPAPRFRTCPGSGGRSRTQSARTLPPPPGAPRPDVDSPPQTVNSSPQTVDSPPPQTV